MSKCTAARAVKEMEYWVGYYEKASSSYATSTSKSCFTQNKGSKNYTYAGYLCGVQGQAWCAAQVSTAIYFGCDKSTSAAKEVMYGVWPYVNCAQVWDAAPGSKKYWSYYQRWTLGKGYRRTYYPQAGDIIVFTDDTKSRSHTGMVYACDKTYVYTIEGNSGNMCRKRSYLLTSSYIYGWIRPNYATASSTEKVTTTVEKYGDALETMPTLHVLSKGCAGPEVAAVQHLLVGYGCGSSKDIGQGEFGPLTEAAVIKFQKLYWSDPDGIVGVKTWDKLLHKT